MGKLSLVVLAVMIASPVIADEVRPGVYRTPDSRFENLPGYDFTPHYKDIQGYRVHYLDEGPADGEVVLLLHGEPTWSYLYRKMIPVLTAAGHRCIVPDLIGFGRSDKPADMDTHTYKFHVDAMTELVEQLDLQDATFFGQDWGSLIGLRVVAENEDRFARVVIGNAGLPIGQAKDESSLPGGAFLRWRAMNQAMIDRGDIPVGTMVATNTGDPSVAKAYDAPFPDPKYKAGALIMPQRVPVMANDPANEANRKAWEVFGKWEKPFLTAFSDGDPVTRGGEKRFQEAVPGAKGQPHTTIKDAGHFLQEQKGEELAAVIVKFIADNPIGGSSAEGDASFVGDWNLKLDFQGNEIEASLSIKQADDGALSGTLTGPRGEGQLEDVKVAGDTLSFTRYIEEQGVSIDFSAKLVDGELEGTAGTPAGEIEFSGARPE